MEWEAEQARREKLQKDRQAMFQRILDHAPAMFSASQLRVFLRALINLDHYSFTDDVAEHFAAEDHDHSTTSEEILHAAVNALADDKLTGFALRLVLTGNLPIPDDGEVDPLTEAEAAFVPAKSKKTSNKNAKQPDPTKANRTATKRTTGKKQDAA